MSLSDKREDMGYWKTQDNVFKFKKTAMAIIKIGNKYGKYRVVKKGWGYRIQELC